MTSNLSQVIPSHLTVHHELGRSHHLVGVSFEAEWLWTSGDWEVEGADVCLEVDEEREGMGEMCTSIHVSGIANSYTLIAWILDNAMLASRLYSGESMLLENTITLSMVAPVVWYLGAISPVVWYLGAISPVVWYLGAISHVVWYLGAISPVIWYLGAISPVVWYLGAISHVVWHLGAISHVVWYLGAISPVIWYLGAISPVVWYLGAISPVVWYLGAISPVISRVYTL